VLRVGPWHQGVDVLGRVTIRDTDEQIAQITKESHEVDMDDLYLGSAAISDLTSLKQVVDLLRVESLGTA
jgi:hypothetical protein